MRRNRLVNLSSPAGKSGKQEEGRGDVRITEWKEKVARTKRAELESTFNDPGQGY